MGQNMLSFQPKVDAGLPVRRKIDCSANRLVKEIVRVIHAGDGHCVSEHYISVRFDDWKDAHLKNEIFRNHVTHKLLEQLNSLGYQATGTINIGRTDWVPGGCCMAGTVKQCFEVCVEIQIDLKFQQDAPTKP